MTRRKKRPPKAIPAAELATILAYADLHSDKAASAQFGVSCRTLQRHRARLRAGARPELAALVDENKREATSRCQDLLLGVYERGLAALARRIDDTDKDTRMRDRDLVGAIHILGNQLVTRNVLIADDLPAGHDREGAPAAGAGPASPGPAPGSSRPSLH